MTPQFLRAEAARFREMAESVADREASRQRLLRMAEDYEERAKAADALQPALPAGEPEPEPEAEPEAAQAGEEAAKARPVRRAGGTRLSLRRTTE